MAAQPVSEAEKSRQKYVLAEFYILLSKVVCRATADNSSLTVAPNYAYTIFDMNVGDQDALVALFDWKRSKLLINFEITDNNNQLHYYKGKFKFVYDRPDFDKVKICLQEIKTILDKYE